MLDSDADRDDEVADAGDAPVEGAPAVGADEELDAGEGAEAGAHVDAADDDDDCVCTDD